ncbi:TRIC cation channel family protein [Gardnerella sp. DNF00354]|uniref:trimeric intracellular cation channel family protein n=1 Tax=Gardnerella TaxID=2701 RepID=UPI003970734F
MEGALGDNVFFLVVEYIAMGCCGMVGGMWAIRKNYDIFAIITTSWLTALGGGIVRDVLLGALPPVGIADRGFVFTGLASGVIVAFAHLEIDEWKWLMLTLDALALGLFAVNGTAKGLDFHMSGMASVFLGMATALGGGLIRDMVLNQVPVIVRDKHWYAFPAGIGCVLTVFVVKAQRAGCFDVITEMILDTLIVVLVVTMRLMSVKFDLTLFGAMNRKSPIKISKYRRHNTYNRKISDKSMKNAEKNNQNK